MLWIEKSFDSYLLSYKSGFVSGSQGTPKQKSTYDANNQLNHRNNNHYAFISAHPVLSIMMVLGIPHKPIFCLITGIVICFIAAEIIWIGSEIGIKNGNQVVAYCIEFAGFCIGTCLASIVICWGFGVL